MKSVNVKKILTCAICALLCVAMLAACSSKNKFEMSDGKYVDKKTGITYTDAPGSFTPIEVSDKLYGKLGEAELYEISGADPEKWLCEKVAGTVFYAENEELPTLAELDVTRAEILLEDVTLTQLSADTLAEVVRVFSEGERIIRPLVSSEQIEVNWRIRFTAESIGLYYTLAFMQLKDGTQIIFDRFTGECVVADGVLDAYVAEYKQINEV